MLVTKSSVAKCIVVDSDKVELECLSVRVNGWKVTVHPHNTHTTPHFSALHYTHTTVAEYPDCHPSIASMGNIWCMISASPGAMVTVCARQPLCDETFTPDEQSIVNRSACVCVFFTA